MPSGCLLCKHASFQERERERERLDGSGEEMACAPSWLTGRKKFLGTNTVWQDHPPRGQLLLDPSVGTAPPLLWAAFSAGDAGVASFPFFFLFLFFFFFSTGRALIHGNPAAPPRASPELAVGSSLPCIAMPGTGGPLAASRWPARCGLVVAGYRSSRGSRALCQRHA